MQSSTVVARLNHMPLGRVHRQIALVIGLGLFFELYDVFLAGVLGTVLTEQFHVSKAVQPLLLGSAFLGMFLGAILLNRMADVIGRKKAFMMNLLIYSVFTFIGAFSPGVAFLIVCRFLAGIGIGAQPPLSDTYLSELLPAKDRGRLMGWAYTLQFCSMPVEGFLARWLVPLHPGMAGWRWLFIIGSLGAVFVWALQQRLPESPRWLEAMGRHSEAEAIVRHIEASVGAVGDHAVADVEAVKPPRLPVSTLFHRQYRGRTTMLWVFQILQTLGYYGFGTLVPLILAAKGYTVIHSLEYTALSFFGYPIGSLISLPLLQRLERKWMIVLSALAMAVFGILFGLSNSVALVVVFGFLYTLVSNVFSNAYHIFQVEIYPTAIRATASGAGYSLSRLMSGLIPFILLPVLNQHGATAMFSVVAAAMVVIMLDIGIFGPRTTGRPLEDVNERQLIEKTYGS
ncbi:MAG: MFS transporter [Alicyclobacillus herbarius]|uniref:MFS transporter n=1 Tax=Alicyclobacillus herbarius TaxID=122960 RepID=UPI002354EA4E|nr:MFS transporter [Alicyclobacillus herbarius]MCL6633440.1 MFS transporter [Alicyclobacillus herbarius]